MARKQREEYPVPPIGDTPIGGPDQPPDHMADGTMPLPDEVTIEPSRANGNGSPPPPSPSRAPVKRPKGPRTSFYVIIGFCRDVAGTDILAEFPTKGQAHKNLPLMKQAGGRHYSKLAVWQCRESAAA